MTSKRVAKQSVCVKLPLHATNIQRPAAPLRAAFGCREDENGDENGVENEDENGVENEDENGELRTEN